MSLTIRLKFFPTFAHVKPQSLFHELCRQPPLGTLLQAQLAQTFTECHACIADDQAAWRVGQVLRQ